MKYEVGQKIRHSACGMRDCDYLGFEGEITETDGDWYQVKGVHEGVETIATFHKDELEPIKGA